VLGESRVTCKGNQLTDNSSPSRWCGLGYLYCSAPSCQINYGPGCDANTRPCGSDTTNVSRPQLGSVPYGVAIYHCEVYGDIALTYDDGPWDYTSDLLDLLKVCLFCHPAPTPASEVESHALRV